MLRWLQGTGARPYLDALPEHLRPAFTEALRDRLAQAYPAAAVGHGAAVPAAFVVAQRVVDAEPTRRGWSRVSDADWFAARRCGRRGCGSTRCG